MAAPSLPQLTNARVQLEEASEGTKVLLVTWELESTPIDGEWTVSWDSMFSPTEDPRSARSDQGGGYFALQRAGAGQSTPELPGGLDHVAASAAGTSFLAPASSLPPLGANVDEPPPTAPLSTARLLAFENGLPLQTEEESLSEFFADRPVVQAPSHILSDPLSVASKTTVSFLLSQQTPVPESVGIYFAPTFHAQGLLAEVRTREFDAAAELHKTWAGHRLGDLRTLQEIAKELEHEGSRGTGLGRVKVGVEGGGMDEEAVRREGWMVGEEIRWIEETYLPAAVDAQQPELMEPLAGLGIATGMTFASGASVVAAAPRTTQEQEQEEEEDLFALPLSPRSPEMAVSPFSMFRGDVVGPGFQGGSVGLGVGVGSKLREVTDGAPPTPPKEV